MLNWIEEIENINLKEIEDKLNYVSLPSEFLHQPILRRGSRQGQFIKTETENTGVYECIPAMTKLEFFILCKLLAKVQKKIISKTKAKEQLRDGDTAIQFRSRRHFLEFTALPNTKFYQTRIMNFLNKLGHIKTPRTSQMSCGSSRTINLPCLDRHEVIKYKGQGSHECFSFSIHFKLKWLTELSLAHYNKIPLQLLRDIKTESALNFLFLIQNQKPILASGNFFYRDLRKFARKLGLKSTGRIDVVKRKIKKIYSYLREKKLVKDTFRIKFIGERIKFLYIVPPKDLTKKEQMAEKNNWEFYGRL